MQRKILLVILAFKFYLNGYLLSAGELRVSNRIHLDAGALAASKDKIVVLNLWRF
ncbi:hypothetical protein [uncultured Campylobacter sp.]|uniref:hypothetical protein n=1 Tax=uncultured Campylobacter sp. TaxID=218934 RepID=UPI002614003A|nr:hypothetical protein [uncultured Campylobacter sp.]